MTDTVVIARNGDSIHGDTAKAVTELCHKAEVAVTDGVL